MSSEAPIQHRGEYVATLKVTGMSGRPAHDGATLMFHCELASRSGRQDSARFNGVFGHVHTEPNGDVGPVWLLDSFSLNTKDLHASISLTVCVAASDVAIRAIDHIRAHRATDDVNFVLWLYLTGAADAGPECQALPDYTATASDWFNALKSARYEARHIIDVPIELGRVDTVLAEAAAHYRSALEQWHKASYTQVLVECRKVLESIRRSLDLKPAGVAEWNPQEKTGWTLHERIEYARAASTELLHPSAHSGAISDPNPREAELALALAGSFLRFYAHR